MAAAAPAAAAAAAGHMRAALRAHLARGRPVLAAPEVELSRRWAQDGGQLAGEELWLPVEAEEGLPDQALQARVPLLLLQLGDAAAAGCEPRPAVLLMHPTGKNKAFMLPHLEAYARRGYVAASLDVRYHGARSAYPSSYSEALVRAWRGGGRASNERPFLLDSVWDVHRVLDYLTTRPDVDSARIGLSGISLGGMISWLAAATDERVAVVAPLIGCQHFGWALQADRWQARAASISSVFDAAAADAGRPADRELARQIFDAIAPGLLEHLDAPATLPLLAPRPCLILNGERDERCPVEGLRPAVALAASAYEAAGRPAHLHLEVAAGVGHEATPAMLAAAGAWMDYFLLQRGAEEQAQSEQPAWRPLVAEVVERG